MFKYSVWKKNYDAKWILCDEIDDLKPDISDWIHKIHICVKTEHNLAFLNRFSLEFELEDPKVWNSCTKVMKISEVILINCAA